MRDPYAYRHVSKCTTLPTGEIRIFTPLMRVVQVNCDSPLVTIFYDTHKPRRNIFLGHHPSRMPLELVAELEYQYRDHDACTRILTANVHALKKVLDIGGEKNDVASHQLIEPFVALARSIRARKICENAITEMRNA